MKTIHVYTDGACSGNPGPMGIGCVVFRGDNCNRVEVTDAPGHGTNQRAELLAVKLGLVEAWKQIIDRVTDEVVVYTDSAYAIGLLSQGWTAKANQDLVADVKRHCKPFHKLRFVKVKGHSGDVENERADELATSAIRRGRR